jgi:hypothetical protein
VRQSETPAAVSAFGVTRVRASPTIDREASVRAPEVYPCLTRSKTAMTGRL